MLAEFAKSKGFDAEQLTAFGVRVGFDGVEVPYFLGDGAEYARYRIRNGTRWFWSVGNAPVIPYGLNRPVPYEHGRVVVCEGESDCWTLWLAGVAALGLPGATSTGCLDASQLEGVEEVCVVREPDEAGMRFPARVARRLRETGFAGRISVISFEPHKDPRAAYNASPARFNEVLRRVWKARAPLPEDVPKTNGTLPVMSAADFLAQEESVRYVVDGLLPHGGSMLLGADKKVGKSVLFLNLALAVARGEPFIRRATTPGRVLYVSIDEPKAITKERAQALGFTPSDQVDFFCDRRPLPDWADKLRELCARTSYALLIIDTLVKLTGIRDLNDYVEWNKAFAPLHSLAQEFGLSFAASAHNRKDARGDASNAIAGSTAAGAGVDTILIETKLIGGARTLESVQRYGVDLEPTILQMDADTFALSLGDQSWLAKRKQTEEKILFLMGDGGTRNAREIIACARIRREDALEALGQLVAEGLVIKDAVGRYTIAGALLSPAAITREPRERPERREPREPSEPTQLEEGAACPFFIGTPGAGPCKRCGRAWPEHG